LKNSKITSISNVLVFNFAFWQHFSSKKRAIYTSDLLFLGIFVCSPSGNHHEVDLARSGYKPNMKDFNRHSIFLAIHTENRIQKI
jgi:hypothetical protein